jgi:hypothetical protein
MAATVGMAVSATVIPRTATKSAPTTIGATQSRATPTSAAIDARCERQPYSGLRFTRERRNARANCLSVRGFVRVSREKPRALGAEQQRGEHRPSLVFASDNRRSGDTLILAIIIAELELSTIDWSVFGVHLAEN